MRLEYNPADAFSIFRYSGKLLGRSLAETMLSFQKDFDINLLAQKGKGELGVLLEKYFFGYEPNNSPDPDFLEAGLELKTAPLKLLKKGILAIKERLVCDKIDYMQIVNEEFEDSRFFKKSMLMLIIFYLHVNGAKRRDLKLIYSALWQIKDKDLIIIKNDFLIIQNKVRQGKAHELSEGDTMYLGACRKGQKDDKPQKQPYSNFSANPRAFCLKTSYMRTILAFVENSRKNMASNLEDSDLPEEELTSAVELRKRTFDEIVIEKIMKYKGLNAFQIQQRLSDSISNGKSACYIALCRIFGVKRISDADEIKKAGIIVKTIRLNKKGLIKESMSFENINYSEIYNTGNWINSAWYDIVTSRFLFVVYREIEEGNYVLDKTFFWTMPAEDLIIAEEFWYNIRTNILDDTLLDRAPGVDSRYVSNYWTLSDNRLFHVRPKAGTSKDKHFSPVSGMEVPRKAYWFNSSYIREKVKSAYGDKWAELFNK